MDEEQLKLLKSERSRLQKQVTFLVAEVAKAEAAVRNISHDNTLLKAELNRYKSLYGKLPVSIIRGETDH